MLVAAYIWFGTAIAMILSYGIANAARWFKMEKTEKFFTNMAVISAGAILVQSIAYAALGVWYLIS